VVSAREQLLLLSAPSRVRVVVIITLLLIPVNLDGEIFIPWFESLLFFSECIAVLPHFFL
jgi:hypothetical protein